MLWIVILCFTVVFFYKIAFFITCIILLVRLGNVLFSSLFYYLCFAMRNIGFYIVFFIFSLFSSCLVVGEDDVACVSESLKNFDFPASAGSLEAADSENPLWLFCEEGDFSSSSCVYAPHGQLNGGARVSGNGKSFSWAARCCSSLANLRQLFCRKNSSILKSFCRADGYYIYMLRKIII